MKHHLFGIRHHGPGSARSLLAALDALRPDLLLVEGPPDAAEALPFLADEEFKPPVALLIYPRDAPEQSVYYPFAEFSPEWQALRWGVRQGVPARWMDLPVGVRLRLPEEEPLPDDPVARFVEDPIGVLSLVSGYGDRELWWELQVEQRRDPLGLFEGILEAMTAIREGAGKRRMLEQRREAWMRRSIRRAQRDGFRRIAVVCGALHAPALTDLGKPQEDEALLQGLGRVNVTATWVPWTHARLARRSGYNAGVSSPGWYQHLWEAEDQAPVRWITRAARLLRDADLDTSAANVIDGVRLAETLAALRDVPMPGLAELNEAILAVFCHGERLSMDLIRRDLEIGDVLGKVPDDVPQVPLQRDFEKLRRRLRMKLSTEPHPPRPYDLRKAKELEKSRLLHRLKILDIPWGEPRKTRGQGTFKEGWTLCWKPEFSMRLVEISVRGATIEEAAHNTLIDALDGEGGRVHTLADLTLLLDRAVLAGLPQAVRPLLGALQGSAVLGADVSRLLDALPPLARTARYGDVRGTDPEPVTHAFRALFERALVRLRGACLHLDDDAAREIARAMGRGNEALAVMQGVIEGEPLLAAWEEVLRLLIDDPDVAAFVRGWACRLLLDRDVLTSEELAARARVALSLAQPPLAATNWLEGLLLGGGLAVLHLDSLWCALDTWLVGVMEEDFHRHLPLLRRAFASFQKAERRAMAEKVLRLPTLRDAVAEGESLEEGASDGVAKMCGAEEERALRVLPVLAEILGVEA